MSDWVRLGRRYRCSLCGSEVLVIRAASQALDPHCCNLTMECLDPLIQVFHCDVCGAEVAVLRGSGGSLELICCHQEMRLRDAPVPEAA